MTPETIRACGFRTITHAAHINGYLSWKAAAGAARPLPAFPFYDPDGSIMTFAHGDGEIKPYVRLKPDTLRMGKDGNPVEYESPKGTPTRADFPPGTRAALADPLIPPCVTRGEKKAATAD